jgi:hypothetical protein
LGEEKRREDGGLKQSQESLPGAGEEKEGRMSGEEVVVVGGRGQVQDALLPPFGKHRRRGQSVV